MYSRDHKKLKPSTSSFTSSQRNPLKSSSEATAVFVLCIHGCLRLEEPLDHGIVAFDGCPVQRCAASEPRPEAKPQAEPKRRGEKFSEIFGASKVEGCKLGPLKILSGPKLTGNIMVLRCFEAIELVEKLLPLDFGSQVTWIMNQNIYNIYTPTQDRVGPKSL